MTPNTHTENFIKNTLHDIVSAGCALNMEPSPIADPQGTYLSDTDEWAQHASEHLLAIIPHLKEALQLKAMAIDYMERGYYAEALELLKKL